jgi:hypothetical protein
MRRKAEARAQAADLHAQADCAAAFEGRGPIIPFSDLRPGHLAALAGLFMQVLALFRRPEPVGSDHVAVDNTNLQANASKSSAMGYAWMNPTDHLKSARSAR